MSCEDPSKIARIIQYNMRDKSGCFVGWETCYVAAKAVIAALISPSNGHTKPRAYYVEHPMFGLKLSLDQPSEEAIERGWVATPLYALSSRECGEGK